YVLFGRDEGTPGSPEISLSRTQIDFGIVRVNETSIDQPVTIENSGSADLSLDLLSISGAHLADFALSNDTCSHQVLAPGTTCSIDLVLTPSVVGERTAQVDVPSNASAQPAVIGLSGTGALPELSITPNAIGFGDVSVGQSSAPGTVTIENISPVPLTMEMLRIIGMDAGDFEIGNDSCSTREIAPSGTCTLDVTFTPSAESPRTAQLEVNSDAPGSPDLVALSGNYEVIFKDGFED
ncbi:MAG TPA: choice-of-anchor D domain-containing protein, partial [Tichowtungia sp.]|nr:choice-of-anchor D domain-containing protein [Tichowtungia sp.]